MTSRGGRPPLSNDNSQGSGRVRRGTDAEPAGVNRAAPATTGRDTMRGVQRLFPAPAGDLWRARLGEKTDQFEPVCSSKRERRRME
jgi:hypothetical protein